MASLGECWFSQGDYVFDKYEDKCTRCGGNVELQLFHQVKLQKCVQCGNVMMHGDDLEQLVGREAHDAPDVSLPVRETIIPQKPPEKKESNAKKGLLSIASHTIIPVEHQPPPVHTGGPTRTKPLQTPQPKPIAPPPPPPPPESNPMHGTMKMDDHNAPSEPELGFGSFGDDIGRKEPILGLPSMSALSTPPAYEENTEDETEEVMNDFFGKDMDFGEDVDYPTEDTELWTEEDELALEQFNNERRRSAGALLDDRRSYLGRHRTHSHRSIEYAIRHCIRAS